MANLEQDVELLEQMTKGYPLSVEEEEYLRRQFPDVMAEAERRKKNKQKGSVAEVMSVEDREALRHLVPPEIDVEEAMELPRRPEMPTEGITEEEFNKAKLKHNRAARRKFRPEDLWKAVDDETGEEITAPGKEELFEVRTSFFDLVKDFYEDFSLPYPSTILYHVASQATWIFHRFYMPALLWAGLNLCWGPPGRWIEILLPPLVEPEELAYRYAAMADDYGLGTGITDGRPDWSAPMLKNLPLEEEKMREQGFNLDFKREDYTEQDLEEIMDHVQAPLHAKLPDGTPYTEPEPDEPYWETRMREKYDAAGTHYTERPEREQQQQPEQQQQQQPQQQQEDSSERD